jgi:hypothetical protein
MARNRETGKQPVRVAPGGPQGSRQQLEGQQEAAPLPAVSATGAAAAPNPIPQGAAGQALPPPGPDIGPASLFAPTGQPNMPIVGGQQGPRIIPPDPDMVLRQMFTVFPHPDIARLMRGIRDA